MSKLSVEDTWHSSHMLEKASGTEVFVAVAILMRPAEPLTLSLRINCGGRSTSC